MDQGRAPGPRRSAGPVVAGLILVGSLLGVAWLRGAPGGDDGEKQHLEAVVGAVRLSVAAPAEPLFDRRERPVSLESYRGRLVFVNFWATWCGPCKAEMPSLVALARSLDPADIAFVSIAEDDTDPPLDAWLRQNPLPFDVYRDRPPRIEDRFATRSYPTSFLLDRTGRVIYRFDGARDWSTPEVRRLLALAGARSR